MKIAVTGKGGVGKTTFAATLARLYAAEGRPVLAADVDPDANLGLALGFDEETLDSIVPISKMRKLVEERTGATAGNQFYHLNPKVDDIPDKYGKDDKCVNSLCGSSAEMFQAGFHIKNHHIFSSQHQIINNTFQHYMLRTYTSAAACLDSSQDKEPYAITDLTIFFRDIVYFRIQMKGG